MKRCPNANCDSSFVFGVDKEYCPFCHSRLIEGLSQSPPRRNIISPDMVPLVEPTNNQGQRNFINRSRNNRVECHGRITEIEHHELFNSKYHKLINTVFRGEPYQLAHQTVEYTIRVEDLEDHYPAEITDFCLFGSYLGRLQVGDEVSIKAKSQGNRRVVKSIYNETVGTEVKPGLQIPAAVIRSLFATIILSIVLLMLGIVWLFKSGAIWSGLVSLLSYFFPVIIIIIGLWFIIRCILPHRRRR